MSTKVFGMAIVSPVVLMSKPSDKNGLQPVMLRPIAGNVPNKNVISGTVAERGGFREGKSYLVNILETESNEYGRNFQFQAISELSALEIITSLTTLGKANLVDVTKQPAATEDFSKIEADPELATA